MVKCRTFEPVWYDAPSQIYTWKEFVQRPDAGNVTEDWVLALPQLAVRIEAVIRLKLLQV